MAVLGITGAVVYAQRNPRFLLLLVLLLSLSTLLLLPWHPASPLGTLQLSNYLPSKFRGSVSLEEFVRREELRYADVLAQRQAMIKQYGPNPDDVDSFPGGSVFYTLWDFFLPAFNCPHRIDRVGAFGDGGKWVCGLDALAAQTHPCVVYSFGVNHDSSFEAALLQRAPACEVWGFDYSVSAFGPEVQANPVLAPKAHFFPYKLGAHDNAHLAPPEYTIQELMRANGHAFVDVLKVDIEGGEFDALAAFLKPFIGADAPPLPIGQLQIEIHAWGDNGRFGFFYPWWTLLERAGLRPFFTEPNMPHVSHMRARPDVVEYSFINVRGQHALITSDW